MGLGPTHSCSTAVDTKPSSATVLRASIGVFATTTKICTTGGSTQAHAQRFSAHRCDPPTRHRFKAAQGDRLCRDGEV